MASQLPLEIILSILTEVAYPLLYGAKGYNRADILGSKRGLASCCLVSHAWKEMAQPKLFSRLEIVMDQPGLPFYGTIDASGAQARISFGRSIID